MLYVRIALPGPPSVVQGKNEGGGGVILALTMVEFLRHDLDEPHPGFDTGGGGMYEPRPPETLKDESAELEVRVSAIHWSRLPF